MAEKVDEKQDEGANAKSRWKGANINTKSQLPAPKSDANLHRLKKPIEAEIAHYLWRIRRMLEEIYDLEKHMMEEEKAWFTERLEVALRRRKNEEEGTF